MMKRIVNKTIHCAHNIPDHEHCGKVHGHSYKIRFEIEAKEKYLDFKDIEENIDKILSKYDHTNITKDFSICTAEEFAEILYYHIKAIYSDRYVKIVMYETDKFGVVFDGKSSES